MDGQEQNVQVQDQVQGSDVQRLNTLPDAEVPVSAPTYIQQVEQLTKAEIQNRLLAFKEEETALLEAAKKFEEEKKAKIIAYAKDHGLEVALLAIVLLKIFGVIR